MNAILLTQLIAVLIKPGMEPIPTIKDIMQEAHRCRTAYIIEIRKETSNEITDWNAVEQKSRKLVTMGNYLARNTPPRGSADSWEKLTTLYKANAVLMSDAAERRNRDDVNYHVKRLQSMCASCHRAHR